MKRLLFLLCAVLFAREAFAEKEQVTIGSTSVCSGVYVQNSSTGVALTGVAWNAAGLTCYYHRNTASSATAITLAAGSALGTYASGMWREVDATNAPGAYQICWPDAMFAAGARSVVAICKGATNMATLPMEFALVGFPTQPDGQVVGSPTPTTTVFALASGQNSGRVSQQLCFTSGTLVGQCRRISAQNGTTTTVDTAFSAAPTAGDFYALGGTTSSGSGGGSGSTSVRVDN